MYILESFLIEISILLTADASLEENYSWKHSGRENNNMLLVPQEGD